MISTFEIIEAYKSYRKITETNGIMFGQKGVWLYSKLFAKRFTDVYKAVDAVNGNVILYVDLLGVRFYTTIERDEYEKFKAENKMNVWIEC